MNFFRLPVIIGALPVTLQNGTTADATQVMADLNWIVNQVNANAASLATVALINVNNNFSVVQSGQSATQSSNFPIASQVQNQVFNTLSSTLGTNTLTGRVSALALSAYVNGQVFTLLPSQINSGDTTYAIDGLNPKHFLNAGSALSGGELRPLIPAEFFYDSGRDAFPLINGTPFVQGPNILSAATLNLGAQEGDYHHVTGTTAISAITLSRGRVKTLVFDSSPVYTNGGSLLLIGGINRTPVSGETSVVRGEAGGVVREVGAAPTARVGSSLVLLASKTASNSPQIVFGTPDFDWTSFDEYQFHFVNFVPATNAQNLAFQISQDGGTTFISSGTYTNTQLSFANVASSVVTNSAQTANVITPTTQTNTGSVLGFSTILVAINPSNNGLTKSWFTQNCIFVNSGGSVSGGSGIAQQTSTLPYNGIVFFYGSGNITSGTVYVYGLRKS